jgi:transposase
VATLNVIRRWALRDQMSIREISRRTGLARNTVKKHLRSEESEPKYPRRVSSSKLDPYAEKLATWLVIEATKSRPRHVRARWYLGPARRSSSTGARTGRSSRRAHQAAGGPRSSSATAAPSAAGLSAADARDAVRRPQPRLRVLGGVPKRGIYDNMKTAVDKVGRGKEREVNARFNAMVSHYLFEAEFCNPASGWEKGQIEKNVQDAAIGSGSPCRTFGSWPRSTTGWRCDAALWKEIGTALQQARWPTCGRRSAAPDAGPARLRRLRRTHQAGLADLPRELRAQPVQRARVVRQPAGQPAGLRPTARHCRRGTGDLRARAGHRPQSRRDRAGPSTTGATTWPCCSANPERFATAHPSPSCRPASASLQSVLLKRSGGDREMVEILALVLQHDEQAVLAAVETGVRSRCPHQDPRS